MTWNSYRLGGLQKVVFISRYSYIEVVFRAGLSVVLKGQIFVRVVHINRWFENRGEPQGSQITVTCA